MATTWLEEQTIRRGTEASWDGGALKVGFLSAAPRPDRGWLARWRAWRAGPDRPMPYLLQLSVTTPGSFERLCWVAAAAPTPAPIDIATTFEDGPPFAPQRGATFELRELHADAAAVVVRAGSVIAPSRHRREGDLDALAPEARAFIAWWLAAAPDDLGAARRASLGHPPLDHRILYDAGSPGQHTTTFHRAGHRFYVRTYTGCLGPMELWYGPFTAHGDRFARAPDG